MENKNNVWVTGSFYVCASLSILWVLGKLAQTLSFWSLIVVIVGGMVFLTGLKWIMHLQETVENLSNSDKDSK